MENLTNEQLKQLQRMIEEETKKHWTEPSSSPKTNCEYSCKCGKLVGAYNAAKQCPECGRLCINREQESDWLKREEDLKLIYGSVNPTPPMMPRASDQFGVHPSWEYAFRFDQNIFMKAEKIRENPKAIYAVLDFEDPYTEMTEETAELTECYLDTVYALLDKAKELSDEAKDINDKNLRLAMMMQNNPKVYELVQRYLSDDMANFIMAKTRRRELADCATKNGCNMFEAFCKDIDGICSNYQDKMARLIGSFNILNNIHGEGNAEIIHLDEYFTGFAKKLYTTYITGNDKLSAAILTMTWDLPRITYPLIYGGGTVTNMIANTIIFTEDCALAMTDKENINYPFIMNTELNNEWRYISGGAYVTFVDCILKKSKELGGTSNASSGEETEEHAGSEMSEDI